MTLQAVQTTVTESDAWQGTMRQKAELLERLVELTVSETTESHTKILRHSAETVDEVVFETEIGGVQYRVIRSKTTSTNQITLSPRELAIAELVAKGLPNKCIGDILDISPWTVATHLRRIFVKLNITSRAAMVACLKEANLL